jgi:hypothetical protein
VSFHHRTVREHLVALDVGHPQLVGAAAGELAVDQVGSDLVGLGMAPLWAAGGASQPGAVHQLRNGVVADHDAVAEPQLGMDPQGAVGAARALVDLGDASVSQVWRMARADGGRDRQA